MAAPSHTHNATTIAPETVNLDWEEWDGQGNFIHHMIAGSIAGVAEHLALFPVDTLKTKIQSAPRGSNTGIRSILRQDGFIRLWRGSSSVLSGCIPAHAVFFSVFETMKQHLSVGKPKNDALAIACAGASATLAHDLIMTPMDVCKQRLQLGHYSGLRNCLREIVRHEGIKALYLSLPTTLAIQVPYACIVTVTNETLKEVLGSYYNDQSIGVYLASGGVAGAVAAAATTPMDVVKTKLQTQGMYTKNKVSIASVPNISEVPLYMNARVSHFSTLASHQYNGFIETIRKIHSEHKGYRGFFRGIGTRMMIHTPSVAISWTVYESIKKSLQE